MPSLPQETKFFKSSTLNWSYYDKLRKKVQIFYFEAFYEEWFTRPFVPFFEDLHDTSYYDYICICIFFSENLIQYIYFLIKIK